ncbi:MAG TPA: hypothetical protein VMF88_06195 [Bacteroidota bacterium]|nr:hypothetical protein [Bacteroidota bacterium]
MVHSERQISPAAKLASMAVASKDVLAGEYDLFVRDANIDRKAYDAGERH